MIDPLSTAARALNPVDESVLTRAGGPSPGIALCVSGGGYRALLFHLGAFWRLNEVGYLPKLARISSVSGGSILAALAGLKWSSLGFDEHGVACRFDQEITEPIRQLAGKTIDFPAVLAGMFLPGIRAADCVARAIRKHLYGLATLQDLHEPPRFVINATNVQSGALWRFMKPHMRDWRVGEVRNPEIPLAVAVAASPAFPPFLSPVHLLLADSQFTKGSGADLQREPFTTNVVLTDGGVYDNLGLETAWKRYQTILVSDGGGKMEPEETPKRTWGRHSLRTLELIDNQVRSLRKRQVIGSFVTKARLGAYWGIRTDISHYQLEDALPCPVTRTMELARMPTRLRRMPPRLQERLINWGYAVCDAAMRKHVDPALRRPDGFPYPESGI